MRRGTTHLGLLVSLAAAGCATLIGFPDYNTGGAGAAGGSATGGSHPAASMTSSTGTVSTGGSPPACVDGTPCYEGLDGTEGVGDCKGGTLSCEGGVPSCSDVRPMVQSCGGGEDTNCDGLSLCTGALRWARGALPAAMPTTVAAGLDGTVASIGITGNTDGEVVVSTFDARGRSCWSAATTFGGAMAKAHPLYAAISGSKRTADGKPTQVICDPDGGGLAASTVIAGHATSAMDFGMGPIANKGSEDGFVAVVDPTGKVAWGTLFGSPGAADRAAGVAIGPKGEIYLGGYVEGPITLAPGCTATNQMGATPNAFVAKLGPDGACAWIKTFTGNSAGTDLGLGSDGNLVVVGRFFGTLGYDGKTIPAAPTMNNTFVAKVSAADGSLAAPLVGVDVANLTDPRLALAPDGSVFVAGDFMGGIASKCTAPTMQQAYLLRFNPSLTADPPSCYYGNSDAVGTFGVAVDGAGSIVLALTSPGPIQSAGFTGGPVGPAVLNVIKLDNAFGNHVWAVSEGTQGLALPGAIAVDGMGGVAITGSALQAFGGLSHVGTFVIELAP
jgi:hypothetical protein